MAEATDMIHPGGEGFAERVTPKSPDPSVFFFKCPCGGGHFRHAGYMQVMTPFMRTGGEKRVNLENCQVMVCVKCRRCHVWLNEQMYDVTDQLDLAAWEKAERELHKATGPGGEC